MEVLNSFLTWIFKNRLGQIENFKQEPHLVQRTTLVELLEAAKDTEIGKTYHFEKIKSYKDFVKHVPLYDYESFTPYLEKNIKGTTKLSDHALGLAGDLMCSGSRNDEIFNWTVANAGQFEVKYIIGNSKIWSPGKGLRACTGSLCGNDNHTTHVHVSFKKPTRTSY